MPPRKSQTPSRGKPRKRSPLWIKIIIFLTLFLVVTVSLAGFYFIGLVWQLPNIKSLADYNPPLATRILASDGTQIGLLYKEKRILVPLNGLPPHLLQAFIASEDSRFYTHSGLDFWGILRALWKNIWAGEIVQGGSTITQQVTKSLLLSPEKSFTRKIKEAFLAYRLDHFLSKNDILYIYLNQIYLGHGAYGVEAAALTYFGKRAKDLNVSESSLLAGLPQAPSRYSPLLHRAKAKERQLYVLKRMAEEGFISEADALKAAEAPLFFSQSQDPNLSISPYFVDLVRKYLYQTWGSEFVLKAGLVIKTTLDPILQRAAQEAVINGAQAVQNRHEYTRPLKKIPIEKIADYCPRLEQPFFPNGRKKSEVITGVVVEIDPVAKVAKVCRGREFGFIPLHHSRSIPGKQPGDSEEADEEKEVRSTPLSVGDMIRLRWDPVHRNLSPMDKDQVEAALFCIESRTGGVKALIGGKNYGQNEFNRAVQSRRQPGSSFKPIIYAAALEKGFTPATSIMDSPIYFPGPPAWTPQNFDHKFIGPTSLRTGLIQSRNIISIKILQRIGVDYAINYAQNLGISSHLYPNLSLALGSSGVSLWEMVTAYNCFPSMGKRVSPFYIQTISDRSGKVLYEYQPKSEVVMKEETAATMIQLLEGVVKEGTGWRLKVLGRPVAGKTGTTNEFRDAWFIGFTPSLTAGAWVGIDDLTPLGSGETGSQAASPIILEFFQKGLLNIPPEPFILPKPLEPPSGIMAGEKATIQGSRSATLMGDTENANKKAPLPTNQAGGL
jgi:penicillin-binding protein 1A